MRKTLATFPLALLVLALAAPAASAHSGHENFLQWRSPGDRQSVSGPAVAIRARVSFDDGVRDWSVEVFAPPGTDRQGFGRICTQTVGGSPGSADIECIWDTTDTGGGRSNNGEYKVKITATNAGRGLLAPRIEAHSGERTVFVNNPAVAPRNVKLSFSEVSRQATVRWDPNPEPDVVRYVVQERRASEPWRTVGETPANSTSFVRRLSDPGSYRYQVAAQRSDGSNNGTLQSSWSGPTSEPKEVVVPDPRKPDATTTTTTGPSEQAGPGPAPDQPAGPGAPEVPPGGPSVAAGQAEGGDGQAPDGERSAAGAPGPGATGGGLLFTPIQGGAPGTVQSKESFSGKLVSPPAAPPRQAVEEQEEDTGFDVALPYPKRQAKDQGPEGIVGVLTRLPDTLSDQDRRPLVIPLAAGLLLFVFAMHALYLSRRAEERMAQVEGDPGADFD
jgi:hypothetical protein